MASVVAYDGRRTPGVVPGRLRSVDVRPTKKKGTRAGASGKRKTGSKLQPLMSELLAAERAGGEGLGLGLAGALDPKLLDEWRAGKSAEEQERNELLNLGRKFRRCTSYVKGEPLWLLEAKEAYESLGTSISLLSYEYDREPSPELMTRLAKVLLFA